MAASDPHPDVQAVLAELEAVGAVRNYTVDGPAGGVPVRIYTTEGEGPFPVFVYFHGGGWVLGNLDTHDPTCRALTNATDHVVVSVDYRRAPEHPFLAPLEDCYAATRWAVENPGAVHGNPDRIVGGDSAGGNLAAAVAQVARDRGGPDLAYQVLIYPATDQVLDTASYEENAEGCFLARADMEWFWDHHLAHEFSGQNAYASPLRARALDGLPPATVLTCGFDPLRDGATVYATRLEDAGVPVTHRRYDEMIHGFASMLVEPDLDQARETIADIGGDLQEALRPDSDCCPCVPVRPYAVVWSTQH